MARECPNKPKGRPNANSNWRKPSNPPRTISNVQTKPVVETQEETMTKIRAMYKNLGTEERDALKEEFSVEEDF